MKAQETLETLTLEQTVIPPAPSTDATFFIGRVDDIDVIGYHNPDGTKFLMPLTLFYVFAEFAAKELEPTGEYN